MSGHGYFRNFGCRLMPFELLGYRALALENELLRVVVLIDKGASIYELLHKPSDTDFLWRWERGLRPRGYVESIPHPRGSFQDHFAGGWDEMFPTFGPAVPVGGLPIGYHGEVAVVPWEYAISSHPMDVGEAERRGTLLRLGPGESLSHEMAATAYTGRQRVRAVGLDGRVERTSDL